MKQEALATALGISQQAVSNIENSEIVEDEKLHKIAEVLGVSADAIKNYSDETVLHNIQNNYDGSVINAGPTVNNNCTFNPLDKVVELYERLLQSEKEKVAYLEKLVNNK